jgi:ribonuclease HIII
MFQEFLHVPRNQQRTTDHEQRTECAILPRVLIYAGIDEAGYGPMIGPLCVACSVFRVDDHDPDASGACDLWKRLKKAVCKKRTDKKRRIAIDDSKKIKLPNDGAIHPLRFLERGVLGMHMAAAECPACDSDLFGHLSVTVSGAPWYSSITSLPVAHTIDELRITAARLRQTLSAESVTCEALRCETIDAESFNSQVAAMGAKSSVNFCAVLRHIDTIWKRWPNDHPRVIVDRQGGRMRYIDDLLRAWPGVKVHVMSEDETLSRYRLELNGSLLTVSFLVEAESAHLPVALASMTAKYVRELFMMRLNRYFQALMPELKPTAGYYGDGRRYLDDIEPLISHMKVDRKSLVRSV